MAKLEWGRKFELRLVIGRFHIPLLFDTMEEIFVMRRSDHFVLISDEKYLLKSLRDFFLLAVLH